MIDLDLDELHALYLEEVTEQLSSMEQALIQLEARPDDPETIATIFRAIHTIKGNASTVGHAAVEELSHALEDMLDAIRAGHARVTAPAVTLLLRAGDQIRELIRRGIDADPMPEAARELLPALRAALEGTAGSADPAPDSTGETEEAAGAQRPERTLRVGVDRLNRMLDLTGEIAIARGRLSRLVTALPRALAAPLAEVQQEVDSLETELQELVMRVRMVPVGPLLRQFARTVRDVAVRHGKQARLELQGEDVEVDTTVIEHLRDPLTHMVRNALDHGIESPERRRAAGKPACGVVTLKASHHAGSLVVTVADDGAGLDRRRIAERARTRGLATDPDQMPDHELFQLVFEPGFTTADTVTDLSGRGVGMDVVRRNLEALRGSVSIESIPGQAARFTLRVPLTLAIIQGFGVGVGSDTYVVPLDLVTECLELRDEVGEGGGRTGAVSLRGEPVPFVRLREHFALGGRRPEREHLVVVRCDGGSAGLVVDRLEGECQTVVKPLGKPLRSLPGIAASTVLGSGCVGLILDVPGVLAEARERSAVRPPRPARTDSNEEEKA